MASNNRRHGALRGRFHFERRTTADDGYGAEIASGTFEPVATVSVGLQPLRGSESVQAARLAGQQPYVVTVRFMPVLETMTTAWRLREAREGGRVLAVTSPAADPDGKRQWLEFIATEGVPA